MKRLTVKEEEIMRMFWEHGPMFKRRRNHADVLGTWSYVCPRTPGFL